MHDARTKPCTVGRVRWWLIGLLAVGGGCGASARPAQPDTALTREIDALADEARADGVVGLTVVVLRGENAVVSRGYGLLDAAKRTPMTVDQPFVTASITKQFWSAAAMKLVEAGRLQLDEPITRVLPAFPHAWVTLAHLLSHTAGLGDDFQNEDDTKFTDLPLLDFAPGAFWQYSNRGRRRARSGLARVVCQLRENCSVG